MRTWISAALRTGVVGALVYGGTLALLHIGHNRLDRPLEAVALVPVFVLLYGLWALAAGAIAAPFGLWWARRRAEALPARWALGAGLFAFQAPFWLGFLLYGLTYDQGPFGPLGSRGGMLAWVATLVVAGSAGAALASWLGARVVLALGRPRRVVALGGASLVLLAGASAVVSGLSAPEAGDPPLGALPRRAETGVRVVLIGLDGADWQVIDALGGELPTFQAFAAGGARAPLATYPDSNSAVIWASVYSTSRPEEHGVGDFYTVRFAGFPAPGIFPVHRTYFKELVGPLERLGLARRITVSRYSIARPPFWEVLDRLGVSTGVADGYYYSLPVEAPQTAGAWRLGYTLDEWMERAGSDSAAFAQADLWLAPTELWGELEPLVVGAGGDFFWQARALPHLLATRPVPELVTFYCHQPDAIAHLSWKWWQPELYLGVDEGQLAERGDDIPAMHRAFDAFLGGLREQLGEETVTIVASDHGQSPTLLHGSFFTQHRHGPPGILLISGGPTLPGATLDAPHVDDLIPTVYWLLGLPVPADAPGRALVEAFDPSFVSANPVRSHPSYRGLGVDLGERAELDAGFNAEEIEKLKALGYI